MICPICGGKVLYVRQRIKDTNTYERFYECIKCFKRMEDETQEK